MSSHTKGPWKSRSTQVNHGVYTSNGTKICSVAGSKIAPLDQRMKADARLIAAAPELLDALIRCEQSCTNDAVGQQARAAIAKATGGAS